MLNELIIAVHLEALKLSDVGNLDLLALLATSRNILNLLLDDDLNGLDNSTLNSLLLLSSLILLEGSGQVLLNIEDLVVTEETIEESSTKEENALALLLQLLSILGEVGNIEGRSVLIGLDEEDLVVLVSDNKTHLVLEETLGLVLNTLLEGESLLEEVGGSVDDVLLLGGEVVAEGVDHVVLARELLEGAVTGDVGKTDNTISDTTSTGHLDDTDFGGVITVSTAASLGIGVSNVDDTESVAGDDTTLVEVETVLLLGLILGLGVLGDGLASTNSLVGLALDLHELLVGQGSIMGDIEVSLVDLLAGTVLPDVRAEHLAGGSVDKVGGGVVDAELVTTLGIDVAGDGLADELALILHSGGDGVEDARADAGDIDDLVLLAVDNEDAGIVVLATGGGVEGGLVQDDDTEGHLGVGHDGEDIDDGSTLEAVLLVVMVIVVEGDGGGEVGGGVEYGSGSLHGLLLAVVDLVPEVERDISAGHLSDEISGDTEGGDALDPVIEGELVLLLLEDLVELLALLIVVGLVELVLAANDIAEGGVGLELTVDGGEILLVALAELEEALDAAELIPPAVLVEDGEGATEDVTDVGATTGVSGEGTVLDGHHGRTRVVENDIGIADGLNSSADLGDGHADLVGDPLPGLGEIIDFVDVEEAGEGTELGPDVEVVLHVNLLSEVLVGGGEDIEVGGGGTVDEPGDTLETDTDIDDLDLEGLAGAIGEGLVLHENHVTDLKTGDEVFNGRTKVTTTSPDILDEGDLFRRNTELLGQPAVVELNALISPELELTRLVEDLNTKHDETGVVTTGDTDVIEIVETDAELRANERVSRGVELTSHAVRLEAVNTGLDIIDIISPTSDDGVTLDSSAGNTSRGKRTLESLPGISIRELLASSTNTTTSTNEAVLLVTLGVTTSNARLILAPVVSTARRAGSTVETDGLQSLRGIELIGVSSELGLRKLLELLDAKNEETK